MTSSGRTLGIAGGVLGALLGALFLGAAFGGAVFPRWLGIVLGDVAGGVIGRVFLGLLAVAILAVDVTLVMRALGFGESRVIAFRGDSGRMAVDVSALEDCLRRAALEDPDVAGAACRLRIPRGGIEKPIVCNVDVDIHERADVPAKGLDLAAAVRRRFLQIIPIETDPVVNVRIRIREPSPGTESAKGTQAMPVAGDGAAEETGEAEKALPDVPDFTGERRYGEGEDQGGESG